MDYKISQNIDEIVLCDSEDFRVVLTIMGDDLIVCNRYISGALMPLPSNYRTKERAESYINALLENGWVITSETTKLLKDNQ
jgi:hypothetical protein